MRIQKTYYEVFALKDGTIDPGNTARKPGKTKYSPRPQIDEDGICTWYVEKEVAPRNLPGWAAGTWHSALATCLNVKRVVRKEIEPPLGRIEREVQALREQME